MRNLFDSGRRARHGWQLGHWAMAAAVAGAAGIVADRGSAAPAIKSDKASHLDPGAVVKKRVRVGQLLGTSHDPATLPRASASPS